MGYQRDEVGQEANFEALENNRIDQSCSPIKDLAQSEIYDPKQSSSNKVVANITVATNTSTPCQVQLPITLNFFAQSELTYEERLLLHQNEDLNQQEDGDIFVNRSELDNNNYIEQEQPRCKCFDTSNDLLLPEKFPNSDWNKIVINIQNNDLKAPPDINKYDNEEVDDGQSVTVAEISPDNDTDSDFLQYGSDSAESEIIFPDETDLNYYPEVTSDGFMMQRRYRPAMKIPMPAVVVSDNNYNAPSIDPFPFGPRAKSNEMRSAYASMQRTEFPKLPKQRSLNSDIPQRRFQLSPTNMTAPSFLNPSSTSPRPRWSIKRGGIPPLVRMNTPTSGVFVRPFSRSQLLSEPEETDWSSFSSQSNQQQLSDNFPEMPLQLDRYEYSADANVESEVERPIKRGVWTSPNKVPVLLKTLEMPKTDSTLFKQENFISIKSFQPDERLPAVKKSLPTVKNQSSPKYGNADQRSDTNLSKKPIFDARRIAIDQIQDTDWWKPELIPIANENQLYYQDFGIQDYLSNENEIPDIEENLSNAGDFDKGLEVNPPSDLLEPVTVVKEEMLGPESPERTESPLLLMTEDGELTMDKQLDLEEVKKQIIKMKKENLQRKSQIPTYDDDDDATNMEYDENEEFTLTSLEKEMKKFREAKTQMVRMASLDLSQLDQRELDEALNIKEDRGVGRGLSSSDDDLEDEIRSVQRLPD